MPLVTGAHQCTFIHTIHTHCVLTCTDILLCLFIRLPVRRPRTSLIELTAYTIGCRKQSSMRVAWFVSSVICKRLYGGSIWDGPNCWRFWLFQFGRVLLCVLYTRTAVIERIWNIPRKAIVRMVTRAFEWAYLRVLEKERGVKFTMTCWPSPQKARDRTQNHHMLSQQLWWS